MRILFFTATLREGETVVDLGSGGGFDVFLAARKVGPTGRAIGTDMTPEMLDLARRNAEKSGLTNVEFRRATIDNLPLPDASVDHVISNCVMNLSPDKPAVFREIARVLKPGGRLAVSDIALKKPLPAEIGQDLMAYVGCIAGAVLIEEYRRQLAEAGFASVEIIDTGADLNAYAKVENQSGCCSPPASGLPVAESGCCSTGPADDGLHRIAEALGASPAQMQFVDLTNVPDVVASTHGLQPHGKGRRRDRQFALTAIAENHVAHSLPVIRSVFFLACDRQPGTRRAGDITGASMLPPEGVTSRRAPAPRRAQPGSYRCDPR